MRVKASIGNPDIPLQSAGADILGPTVESLHMMNATCQFTMTAGASPSGVGSIQGSNDGQNWADIGTTTTISANGTTFALVSNAAYTYMRAKFHYTSGSGTIIAFLTASGPGN